MVKPAHAPVPSLRVAHQVWASARLRQVLRKVEDCIVVGMLPK